MAWHVKSFGSRVSPGPGEKTPNPDLHGARLITTNRTDFELINKYREIRLEVW
jgi:hypothetical protein